MTASVSEPVIELHDIVKVYGRTVALDGIDLAVGRGELVGLLGPNGAGKTTTVKLLLGLASPTSGTGRILGAPLGDRAVRRRIGYLPELFRYQPWLRAREVLRLHAELAGLPSGTRRQATTDALEHVDLGRPGGRRRRRLLEGDAATARSRPSHCSATPSSSSSTSRRRRSIRSGGSRSARSCVPPATAARRSS